MPRWDRHVADGALVRLIDGESFGVEEATTREHLARCNKCRERHRYLEALSDRTSELLFDNGNMSAVGLEPPAAARRPLLGSISVILIVFVVAGSAWAWVATVRSRSDVQHPAQVLEPSASIAFRPTGRMVELRFASAQSSGALELQTTVDSLVRVTVLGGDGQEALSVSTRGVGIVNRQESPAVYAVQIPQTVDSVTVEVGGDVLYRIGTDGLAAGTLRLTLDSTRVAEPGR
jgi:hypothetical protein